jgi:hypothetical protein
MSRVEKVLVHASSWLVAGSGLVYGWMKYFVRNDDPFSAVNHPWQPAALAWHVLVAPLLVFAVGMIAQEHILSRVGDVASSRGRSVGALAAAVVVPMVVSGYGLQVVTDEALRPILLWVHLGTSALFCLAYLAHVALSRWPALGARSARRSREGSFAGARVEEGRPTPAGGR